MAFTFVKRTLPVTMNKERGEQTMLSKLLARICVVSLAFWLIPAQSQTVDSMPGRMELHTFQSRTLSGDDFLLNTAGAGKPVTLAVNCDFPKALQQNGQYSSLFTEVAVLPVAPIYGCIISIRRESTPVA